VFLVQCCGACLISRSKILEAQNNIDQQSWPMLETVGLS